MNKKWNQMTKGEKTFTVFSLIAGIVAIVFAIGNMAKWWDNGETYWKISFAAMLIFDGLKNRKDNRKLAIIDIVLAVVLLAFGIVQLVV